MKVSHLWNFQNLTSRSKLALVRRKIFKADGGGADDFVKDLLDDLTQLKFHEKSNDLYKFIQTDELFLSKSRGE